jgi:hypothetical protein
VVVPPVQSASATRGGPSSTERDRTIRRVRAVSIARSENFCGAPRRRVGLAAVQELIASGEIHMG